MSLNYGFKVRGDLDKLLDTDVIFPIQTAQWISLLVVIAKKNGKLRIHVNYGKLNAQMKKDPFPLQFLDSVLN
jgi:hypothetical protein